MQKAQEEEVPRLYTPQGVRDEVSREVRDEVSQLQLEHQWETRALRAEMDMMKKAVKRIFYDPMCESRRCHNMGQDPWRTELKTTGAKVARMLDQFDEVTGRAFV